MDVRTHQSHASINARRCSSLVLAVLLSFAAPAFAQEQQQQENRTPFAVELLLDPTTYVPAGLLYTSMRLDWSSSQPFFQNGFLEDNPRYTVSGLPKDRPLGYGEGNTKILKDSLAILPASFVNNALTHMMERRLSDRYPEHRKLWKALSWVERVAFASYISYRLSGPHFRQWQKNERLARQYGFVQQ
jgi:hypothetical protein